MRVEPVENVSFKRIYDKSIKTSYGKCVMGHSNNSDYFVYVAEDEKAKEINTKLYYITRNNKWAKSILRFFRKNQKVNEIRSVAK